MSSPLREDNYYWAEAFQWERTSIPHVWKRSDGKFHYSDEASQFSTTQYDDIESARAALDTYVVYLNQPKEK